MDNPLLIECQWPYLQSFLPPREEFERSAEERGALKRRRAVHSASDLLRLALAYGFCGLTLRQTAAWAQMAQVANLSDVALLKRLRSAHAWLGHILAFKLAERATPPSALGSRRLRLLDATVVCEPGSQGTDWRIHLGFDLGKMAVDHLEVTDASGAESLRRLPLRAGDLVLGDRGYAHRQGFQYVREAEAHFLVRVNWQNVPLQTPTGAAFDLLSFLRRLPEATPAETWVRLAPVVRAGLRAWPARLVAVRKSEAAAEKARADVLRERSKKGGTPDPRSLETAGYTFVLTSLPEETLATPAVLEVYRFRWQIELAFKRLKSLLHLGSLPARDPPLARCVLYSKLLGALLLEDFTTQFLAFSPWGFRLAPTSSLPLAHPARPARRTLLRDPGADTS